MKRIEYDMYRSLAVWGRRVIKTENAVSRMKRVVSGTHWNFDHSWDWLSPLNAPAFERMPRSDWEWRNKCRLIF
jgi:hypothetical protein